MQKKNGFIWLMLLSVFFLSFLLFSARGWAADPEIEAIHKKAIKEIPGLPIEILEGAKKEGKLMIYHLVWKEAMQEMIGEFKKRFPFIQEIDTFMASGGPLHLKFTSEVRSGRAIVDIWQHTAPWETDEAADEGLLMKYVVTSDAAYPPH